MRLNGNLELNALGASQIVNLVVEKLGSLPSFNALEKGRIVYNTADNKLYSNNGTIWVALATGGDASALLAEVDNLEVSLGALVGSNGSFVSNGVTFTKIATPSSISDALGKLDGAIAAEATRATSAEGTNAAAIAAEVTRATDAEGVLTTAVSDEAARATAAEGVLTSAVGAEVTRATAAEVANAAAIAAEVTRAEAAETVNAAAVVTEAAARVAADAVVAANAADATATENTQRTASDTAINARIDTVQGELDITQAGAGLGVTGVYTAPSSTAFLGLATSLANADVLLDAAITAEAATRAAADTGFSAALTAETAARVAGDAALTATVEAYVDAAVGSNAIADVAEAAARVAADAGLQAELDATQVGAGLLITGAYNATSVAGTNYLSTSVSLNAADILLDTAVKAVATALAGEVTNRTNTDTQINADLTAEIANRIALDTDHQAELDAIEAGAGLEGNGNYLAPTGSNYLGAATDLKDADFILDSAIKSEVTRATAAEVATAAGLAAEITRATTAEGVNATAIATETTRATTAEGVNATAIGAETTRAEAAEGVLAADIAALSGAVTNSYYLYDGASATSHVITHGLAKRYCNVTVIDATTNEQIIPQGVTFNATDVTVTLNQALAIKVVLMAV